jgi:hypothetical protein
MQGLSRIEPSSSGRLSVVKAANSLSERVETANGFDSVPTSASVHDDIEHPSGR